MTFPGGQRVVDRNGRDLAPGIGVIYSGNLYTVESLDWQPETVQGDGDWTGSLIIVPMTDRVRVPVFAYPHPQAPDVRVVLR